ncbi:hypothetical protein [Streptomyces sp. BK340]|uniref:hypothetical protein n=1 Tax=Streptomyces sp. BK340 TaxID=2572903 RepID=UPI0011A40902|nr:hypothetical protein [Streptomyces sp. BK340]
MNAVIACVAGLMAAGNLVQVIIGRQLIKPSASKRSASQLRRESAAAAVAMIGTALAAMHVFWGLLLTVRRMASMILTRKQAVAN